MYAIPLDLREQVLLPNRRHESKEESISSCMCSAKFVMVCM